MTQKVVEILSQLVNFNTISEFSNLKIIEWLENFCQAKGGVCQRIYSDDKQKANLLVRFGPQIADGIIISGHTDVVPTKGQQWNSEPFTLVSNEGSCCARGTCDMKGPIACALTALEELHENGQLKNLKKPLYFSFSYDEEVGCIGVERLVEFISQNEPTIQACFVIEPTNLIPLKAHKGICVVHTQILGVPAHSSQTHIGVSAVQLAGECLHWINNKATELSHNSNENNFNPPYTTVHSGVIKGGTVFNIMAEHCDFYWDIRYLPKDSPQNIINDFEIFCEQLCKPYKNNPYEPLNRVSIANTIDSAVRPHTVDQSAEDLLRKIDYPINFDTTSNYVAYVTEAGLFQQKNIPTIVCGPGNPLQAHQPNEHISIEQLNNGVKYLQAIYQKLL